MNNSGFNLDFGFLGTNHHILNSQKAYDIEGEKERNKGNDGKIEYYKANSLSRFLLKHVLYSKKTGIFEVSYIPNISPIDVFMKNCSAEDTVWVSCHKQSCYVQEGLKFVIVRDISELLYFLSKVSSKKVLIITHLSHIITSHLIEAATYNQNANSSISSTNDYKSKLLTRLFQQFISKFNKTILINQFMNSKNNDFGKYMLKTELENGLIGKGTFDLIWQRLINYKIGIYNNTQIIGGINVVVETGQRKGNMKVYTLYQYSDETEVKQPNQLQAEQENNYSEEDSSSKDLHMKQNYGNVSEETILESQM